MRVFEDSCCRLMDAPADHDERKALVYESLENAMEVSDAVADAEDMLPDAMEEAGKSSVGQSADPCRRHPQGGRRGWLLRSGAPSWCQSRRL